MRMPSERDAMNGPGQDDDNGSSTYSDQELRDGPSEAYSHQEGDGVGQAQRIEIGGRWGGAKRSA